MFWIFECSIGIQIETVTQIIETLSYNFAGQFESIQVSFEFESNFRNKDRLQFIYY